MQRNLWYRLEDICDWSGLKLLICDGVRSGIFFVTGGSTLAVSRYGPASGGATRVLGYTHAYSHYFK